MHVVGGYGNLRVDRNYHHVYDAAKDAWGDAAPLPRGASHIGVAAANGMLYAIGGFVEQNRLPHDDAFVFDHDLHGVHADRHQADRSGTGDEDVLAEDVEGERRVDGVAERVEDRRHVAVDPRGMVPDVGHRQGDVLGERPRAVDAHPLGVLAEGPPSGEAVAAEIGRAHV